MTPKKGESEKEKTQKGHNDKSKNNGTENKTKENETTKLGQLLPPGTHNLPLPSI